MNKKKNKKLSKEELKKRKLKEKKFALIFIIAVMTFYAVLIIIIMIQRSSPDYVPPENVSSDNGSGRLLFFVAVPIWLPLLLFYRYYTNNSAKFMRFSDIYDEVMYSKNEDTIKTHFVYAVLLDFPKSEFVLMLDEYTKEVFPAVYTKFKNKISIFNRDAEYTEFERSDLSYNDSIGENDSVRSCRIKNKKTGDQVLFVAVPNRKTDILAYSDSTHIADKSVTFGKFRIFCFIEPTDKPNTDLYVNMQKIHLKKLKSKQSKNRSKFIPFITLDETTQS